jgi:hypothetical protein
MARIDKDQLVGSWRLERWATVYPDGSITEPLGAGAQGLLLYAADGWMSACIMSADRPALSRANPRNAPAGERAAAFDGYFSYAGRWSVRGGRVRHDVTVALNPAMIGTLQWRDAQLAARTLTLSAREAAGGGSRLHELTWRRCTKGRKP